MLRDYRLQLACAICVLHSHDTVLVSPHPWLRARNVKFVGLYAGE